MRLLVLLAALLCGGPALAEQRVALVLGNGAYASLPPLPNPASDAAAVAARLRRLGFAVTQGTDLDKAAMDRAIRAFGRAAAAADVAMVFYAGHGVQVSGRNYLVPVDARMPQREQDLRYDFVDVAGIMEELAGVRHLRILVLDACRDNPVAAALGAAGRGLGQGRGLAAPAGLDNTLIAYATAADATAADGNGPNSPFTAALLAHLEDPGLDIRLMFGRVRDSVRRATGNQQNPFVYESLGGDGFSFNPGPAAPIPPAPPREPVQEAAVVPVPPRPRTPDPDWAAWLSGRWRFADGRPCTARFGTATVQGGTIRFEWRLPNGRTNVAVERIDAVSGATVETTVLSDVGTPTPETGNRIRYRITPDRWVSENLDTRERAVHTRC